MRKTLIFLAVFIIGLVFAFIVISRESSDFQVEEYIAPVLDTPGVVEINHSYANGEHKVTGVLTLPSPCYELQTDAVVMESFPEQVRIDFKTPLVHDMCAQVLQDENF